MSEDKTIEVHGAEVAARILRHLSSDERTRIVKAIRATDPEAAVKIETIILAQQPTSAPRRPKSSLTIEKITEITDSDLQNILRNVPQQDVLISLKTASPEVKEKIINNLSESRKEQVEREFSELPGMNPAVVEAAQDRIMKRVEDIYQEETPTPPPPPQRLRSRLA